MCDCSHFPIVCNNVHPCLTGEAARRGAGRRLSPWPGLAVVSRERGSEHVSEKLRGKYVNTVDILSRLYSHRV